MNKKGAIFLGCIVALMIFLAGTLFIEHFKSDITTARTDLSCSNPTTISDGTKVLCLMMDGLVPYYILVFLSLVGGFVMEALK